MRCAIPILAALVLASCDGRDDPKTQPRSANESDQSIVHEDPTITPKKEWDGESGYCNCLLVAMSRMQIARLDLSTNAALPNLDELTESRPDSNAWIKAQDLGYDSLDRLTIIRMLAESAEITPKTGNREGTIEVHDVVGDDGDIVKREFHLSLDFDGEHPVLTVIQRGINNAEQGAAPNP
jgi:hypothetical protein